MSTRDGMHKTHCHGAPKGLRVIGLESCSTFGSLFRVLEVKDDQLESIVNK